MDRFDRALDVRALESRFRQPDFTAAFGRVEIERFPQLLAHELIPFGTLHAEELEGPIHTLRWPVLSDFAARAFFRSAPHVRIGPYTTESHQEVSISNSLLRRYAGGAEVLPEEIFDIAAREACRFKRAQDCATIVARWSVEYPESDLWRATLAALRKRARPSNLGLVRPRFEKLRALHSGRAVPIDGAALPLAEAQEVTALFFHYYNHIVQFDRRLLEVGLDRCGGEDCGASRSRFDPMLREFDGSASR
jgi:hypothetical protein